MRKFLLVFPAIGLSTAGTAQAAGSTWLDTGNTSANWSSPTNWGVAGVPGATSGTTDADIATFNTAVGTEGTISTPILIDSGRNIKGITFDTSSVGSYYIGTTGGNALLLTSGGTIQLTATAITATENINAPLVIEGTNGTYTFANNSTSSSGQLDFGGRITGGAAGSTVLTLNGSGKGTNTISGIIANGSATSLGIVVGGSGTWVLSNADTYTGTTTVSGTLDITGGFDGSGAITTSSGGIVNISGSVASSPTINAINGTVEFSGAGTASNSAIVIGAAGNPTSYSTILEVTGQTAGGTYNLSSSLTYGSAYSATSPYDFVINGISAGNTVENFGALTLNPGALDGHLAVNSATNLQVDFSSITRNPESILYFGLTGVLGSKTISSATANTSNLVFSTAPTLSGNGGGAGSSNISILPYADVNAGLATYDSTYGLRAVNTTTEMATLINGIGIGTGSAGQNAKVTGGTTSLSLTNTVNALESMTASNTITFAADSSVLTVSSGAIDANQNLTIGSGTVGSNGQLNFGSAEGILIAEDGRILTVNSQITGSGGLTVFDSANNSSDADVVFTNANTFTGITAILSTKGTSGTQGLTLDNTLALQNSTVDYNNYGGSLFLGDATHNITSFTLGGLKGDQALALTNSQSNSVTLTVGSSLDSDSTTYSGILSGGGSLIKAGSGTLTLTGANTYTGGTTVSGGTLQSSNVTGLGSASGTLAVNGGGTLDIENIAQTVGAVTLGVVSTSTGSTIQSTGGTKTLTTSGVTVNGTGNTIASSVSMTGAITQSSSSGLTVNGTGGADSLNTSATLAGTGTVGAVTLAGGNTLSSTATLTTSGIQVSGLSNSISGGTVGGNITFSGTSGSPAALALANGVDASGTVNVSTYSTLTTTGATAITGALTLGGGAINMVKTSSVGTLTVGSLTSTGGGSLTFALGNNSLTNDSISSGALSVSNTTTINIANLNNAGSQTLATGNYNLIAYTSLTSGSLSNFDFSNSTQTETFDGYKLTLTTLSGNGSTAGDLVLNVANLNSAVLNLPGTALTLNERTNATGTPGSTFVSNSDTVSTGTFTASTMGAVTLSPSSTSGTVAPNGGTTTLNAGWTTTTTAGAKTGTITIVDTANSADTGGTKSQAVTGGVYDFAQAKYTGTTLAFGYLHTGATAASQTVAIGNQTITSAAYQDSLAVSASSNDSLVTATGFGTTSMTGTGGTGLAPSTSGATTSNVTVAVSTATAGSLAGTVSLTLNSVDTEGAGLANGTATTVGTPTAITTTGTVYNGLSTWTGTGSSGNWGSITGTTPDSAFINNWSQGAPGVSGSAYNGMDTATFGNVSGQSAVQVNLNGDTPNLNSITFNTPAATPTTSYTIGGGSDTGTITLSGTTPKIAVTAGSHTIAAPVVLGANTSVAVVSGQQLTISGNVSDNSSNYSLSLPTVANGGGGTTILNHAGGNNYGGGTSVAAGKLYVDNGSNSGTGTGSVSVTGGTLAGTGLISGKVALSGGSLYSGGVPTGEPVVSANTSSSTTGMTLTNTSTNAMSPALSISSANLTFALGTNTTGGGTNAFSNPSYNSTYMQASGLITFSGSDTISLVDLTNTTGINGTLSLRTGTPYVLIADSLGDAGYSGLVIYNPTTGYSLSGGSTDNGYVVGVANSDWTVADGATDVNQIMIGQFGAYGSNGMTALSAGPSGIYPAPALYLYNGDLEVVPEPGTWALMLGGLALLIVIQRRRNKLD